MRRRESSTRLEMRISVLMDIKKKLKKKVGSSYFLTIKYDNQVFQNGNTPAMNE